MAAAAVQILESFASISLFVAFQSCSIDDTERFLSRSALLPVKASECLRGAQRPGILVSSISSQRLLMSEVEGPVYFAWLSFQCNADPC